MHERSALLAVAITALAGGVLTACPSPMEPPPPEEPMIAAPEAPRIPWLAAGTPDIAPPQIPWLTDESACPEGWGWVELAPGLNGCDPYPTGRIEDCGPTGAHFPGEMGCRDLDSGDTEWPSDLPATNVLYVREGASGGDGTIALPFATLPEALAVAVEGTTIALGPGRYDAGQGDERTDIAAGVFDTLSKVRAAGIHIRGTSVAQTTVYSTRPASPTGSDFAMIQVEASDVEISDLRFESPHPAIDAFGGAVTARRIVLDGPVGGLSAGSGGSGTFEDIVVVGGSGPPAVFAGTAGRVILRRAVVSDTTATLAAVGAGAELSADAVAMVRSGGGVALDGGVMHATRLAAFAAITGVGSAGVGSALDVVGFSTDGVPTMEPSLFARDGASLSLDGGRLQGVPGMRSQIAGLPDSSVTITRSVFSGAPGVILEGPGQVMDVLCRDSGICLETRAGDVVLSRLEITGEATHGMVVHLGGSLTASDLWIHDLSRSPAVAVYVLEGASARVERASIERAQTGLYAQDASTVSLTDVTIRELRVMDTAVAAGGVQANGSTVSLHHGLIEHVEGPAVVAFGAGHSVDLEDVVIREFSGPPGNSRGIGIYRDGATSSIVRVDVGGGRGMGVNVLSDAHLEDLSIHDVETDSDGSYGQGLVSFARPALSPAAHVTGTRIVIRDVATWGLGGGATAEGAADRLGVTLSDVRIERAGTATGGGAGIFFEGDADVSLTDFVVRDAASVGVMTRTGARLTLTNGLVVGGPTCTSSDAPLDLATVQTDGCGAAPVTWTPPDL